MEINEVKIGDTVSFTHRKKKVTGKVVYRHGSDNKDAAKAALMGHVNVKILDGGSYPVTVHVSKLKPALKEETQMKNIEEQTAENTMDLIDLISSSNHIEAENKFNELLQVKIDEILSAAKQEVASTMFNTQECAECSEEDVEEAVVIQPTSAVQAAIDAYKKKKAASSATHDGKTNPPMPAVKSVKKEEAEVTSEALKGNQHKIDANKNGKIDAHDFKMLRAKKKGMKEGMEQIDELSPATLKSYDNKATKDLETHNNIMKRKPGFEKMAAKRHKGIQAARTKMKG